jgi:hypothetical protein
MSNEHDLRRKVAAWLRTKPEWYFLKIHGSRYQRAGVPDWLLCIDGRLLAIELKVPGGCLSALQWKEMRKLYDAGAVVQVCCSLEEFQKTANGVQENWLNERLRSNRILTEVRRAEYSGEEEIGLRRESE